MPGKTKAAVIILWIGAALGVCLGLVAMAALESGPVETSGAGSVVFAIILVASLLNVVFAIAIQKRQNWARITTIVLCAIGSALQLVSLFTGDVTALVGLALNIAIIVLLASEESKEWCGA
jgi:hypothetical protein